MRRWLCALVLALLPGSYAAADEGEVATWMERGKTRLERKDYLGALDAFAKVLGLDPKRAEAYVGRAKARAGLSAARTAIQDLDRAIELDPKLGEAFAQRARYRDDNNIGNRDDIIPDCTKAMELNTEPGHFHFLRSTILREKGDLEAALADANKSIGTGTPIEAWRRHWRGKIRMRLEDFDGAVEDFSRYLAEETNPAAIAYLQRGYCYLRAGKAEEAAKDFAAYVKALPDQPKDAEKWVNNYRKLARLLGADKQPEKAEEYLKRAGEIADLGLNDWAVDDATRALAVDPNSAAAHFARGKYLYQLHFYTSALADFEAAVKLNPKSEVYYDWKAATNREVGKWDAEIADGRRALEIDNRYSSSWLKVAHGCSKKNQWAEALAAAAKAIECSPADPDAWDWRQYTLKYTGKLNEAVAALDQAITLSPKNADYCIQRGEVLAALGKTARAEADFAKAIELDPTSSWAYCSRGEMRLEKGDLKGALADFDKSIQNWQGYSRAYLLRGLAKEKAGDPGAAEDKARAFALRSDLQQWLDEEYRFRKFAKAAPPETVVTQEEPAIKPAPAKVPPAARKMLEVAKAVAAKGDWEAAAGACSRAITLAPRCAEAYLQRGLARLHLKQQAEAEEDFQKALRCDPDLKATLEAERAKVVKGSGKE